MVNVLKHARDCFPDVPVHAVLGGLHLAGVNEGVISETVEALREFDLRTIAPAHCTSWHALTALGNAFGDRIAPAAVGKRYTF